MHRVLSVCSLALALSLSFGCGHTEEEWQMQLDKNQRLDAEKKNAENKAIAAQKELEDAEHKVAVLTKNLQDLGVEVDEAKGKASSLATALEDREKALAEYKIRARQLESIKTRFEVLRKKLEELTKVGLAVAVRKNRMVISLPGDVLFDSGRETLRKDGKAILAKVASVIKADQSLAARDYQVAGHTDSKVLKGGQFKDNWGLSLMRAREVLVFLVNDPSAGLPSAHWSAAGFAETDPIADNQSDEGRQKNRRCELIVVPSAEEVLDLKALAQ